jgi:8-oxo-dGTP pyrophosphatase MutT (NUDIX family)
MMTNPLIWKSANCTTNPHTPTLGRCGAAPIALDTTKTRSVVILRAESSSYLEVMMTKFEQLMDDLHVQPNSSAWHDHQLVWNRARATQITEQDEPRHHVGVAVALYNGFDVLLQHRRKDFGHGLHVLTGGKIEEPNPVDAALREVREELGLELLPHKMEPLWIAHDVQPNGDPYLMLYYAIQFKDRGTERNMEPDKCYSLSWHHMCHLPDQMWANDRRAIDALYWRITR